LNLIEGFETTSIAKAIYGLFSRIDFCDNQPFFPGVENRWGIVMIMPYQRLLLNSPGGINLSCQFKDRDDARKEIFSYIELF